MRALTSEKPVDEPRSQEYQICLCKVDSSLKCNRWLVGTTGQRPLPVIWLRIPPLPFGKGKEGKGLSGQALSPVPLPTGEGDKFQSLIQIAGSISKFALPK